MTGQRDAEINVASGKRKAQILRSEAQMQEAINLAEGDAQAIRLRATARRQAIQAVSEALSKQVTFCNTRTNREMFFFYSKATTLLRSLLLNST